MDVSKYSRRDDIIVCLVHELLCSVFTMLDVRAALVARLHPQRI